MDSAAESLVSIIITTHNRRELVVGAINSALAQSYRPIEIVVVDDGSTDGTAAVLDAIEANHTIVRTVSHPQPRGGNAARNSGIRAARGQFIAGLDDDDCLLPDHVRLLMQAYTPTHAMIAARAVEVYPRHEAVTPFHGEVPIQLITLYNAVGNQGLIEKARLEAVGLYDEALPRYQDHDMWIRLIDSYGSALVIAEVTQRIRVGDAATKQRNRQKDISGASILLAKHYGRMSLAARAVLCLRIKAYQGANTPTGRLLDLTCKILTKVELARLRLLSIVCKD